MKKFKSYINLTSVTWWSGVFLILIGVAQIICRDCGYAELGQIAAAFMGSADGSPVALIALGMGLIGARRAIADA